MSRERSAYTSLDQFQDYEREDIPKIMATMGGDGDCISPIAVGNYWRDFSNSACASWLSVDTGTITWFAGWMIHRAEWAKWTPEERLRHNMSSGDTPWFPEYRA